MIAKYKNVMYYKGSFRWGNNTDLNLITCEDNIIIAKKIQIYVLDWYNRYILHPGMKIMEAIIFQNLYWPDIRDAVRREVSNCDTCQR